MLAAQTNTTTLVGRLRIRSATPDPLAEQQRMHRLLRDATLWPAGLPACATLVVRQLDRPLPLRLTLSSHDSRLDASWQQAVTGELDRMLAQATRPALGPVPAGAKAVLFLDRAELLAAMALDWLSRTLQSNWWWREFLRNTDAATVLFKEWLRSPESVPAACEILGARSRAVDFVRILPESVIAELLALTLRAHAVPTSNLALVVPEPEKESSSAEGVYAPKSHLVLTSGLDHAPWLRWVPEASAAGLSPVRRVMLAQALMLRRAPGKARTVAFQTEVLGWRARQPGAVGGVVFPDLLTDAPEAVAHSPAAFSAGPQTLPLVGGASLPTTSETTQRDVSFSAGMGGAAQVNDGNSVTASDGAGLREPPSTHNISAFAEVTPVTTSRLASGADDKTSLVSAAGSPAAEPATLGCEVAQSEPKTQFQPAAETAYGGVFFLLNVAVHLNLYGDFTAPLQPGLELNIWDFLSLLGSELTAGEIENDDLWRVLAALAGRPEWQRPGAGFQPPGEWEMPPGWLNPFPEPCALQQVLCDGRRVTLHPAGFIVADQICDAESRSEQVDVLKRWSGWMTGYIRARLVRAFGREDAAELLCRLPARVASTPMHVNVSFSLNHHPIEVRLAGTDRDPGWIPAAGRHVTFRFD
jgi:hypothetical protein